MIKSKKIEKMLADLIKYKDQLTDVYNDRKSLLDNIDNYSNEELENISMILYNQKNDFTKNKDSALNKLIKSINDDLTYNDIWIKETTKKIDKLSNK